MNSHDKSELVSRILHSRWLSGHLPSNVRAMFGPEGTVQVTLKNMYLSELENNNVTLSQSPLSHLWMTTQIYSKKSAKILYLH